MNEKIYEKLKKVREQDDISIQPCEYLKDEVELRDYQIQMVYHMLLMRRFVVGDDTGLGKCISGDSLVETSEGLIPMEDLHDWDGMEEDSFQDVERGLEVLIGDESLPVKRFYYGGEKKTLQIETRYGFDIEGSQIHPVKVWRNGEHQWIQTQDIEEGDYICIDRREADFPDEEPELNTDVNVGENAKTYHTPEKMNPDLARLMAYIVGEGTLGLQSSITISQCPDHNPAVHEDILSVLDSVFDYQVKQENVKDKKIHSSYLREYFYQNGLDYVKSPDREIPLCVLKSTRKSQRHFIRGLFDGEGSVHNGGIELSTSSKKLADQTQTMLLRFGIVANVSSKKVKGYEHNNYWRLTISGYDVRLFRDEIGFLTESKHNSLEEVLDKNVNCNHDVIPNAKPLIEDLRSLLKEKVTVNGDNDRRKGSGLKQYGRSFVSTLGHIRNSGRNPKYQLVGKFLKISKENGLENTDAYQRLESLIETHYFYDPVKSIEESESEVYDLEVDDPRHCFVANGIVNHNTVEALSAQCYIWEKEPNLVPIVVTKTSALRQWGSEIDKFTTDEVDWVIAEGGPEDREEIYEEFFSTWDPENPSFLIVNYHRLRRDKRFFQGVIEENSVDYVIHWDEASAFKSTKTLTHKVAKQITEEAERAYGLTATLIKNNLEDGYGIFNVIQPELFRTKKGFHRDYCVTRKQKIPGKRNRYIKVVVGHTDDQIKKFKEAIDPYYLGRAKHDVAEELPALVTKEIEVPMGYTQWDYYKDSLDGLLTINQKEAADEEEEEKETTKLTQLIYCQQIVNSPHLIGNRGDSGKEEYLMDLLEGELENDKVVVFTRFKEMVNRFQHLLEDKGYDLAIEKQDDEWEPIPDESIDQGFTRITGAEDSDQRDAAKRAFKHSDDTNIIFITTAGSDAINLQQANVMVFYDLPWSAGNYLQIIGRMIRIGSPHDRVYAIHIIGEGPQGEDTIDHHVSDTLQKKMDWIESALGDRLVEGSEQEEGGLELDEEEVRTSDSNTEEIFEKLKESAKEQVG